MSAKSNVGAHVYGPLISAARMADHQRLFTEVFGMRSVGRTRLDAGDTAALFESASGTVEVLALQTPGVMSGVVVLEFDPVSAQTIRSTDARVDRDALKVIDFYAPDYEAALAHARGLGYEVVESEAEYALEAGTFREAHLWASDNVVTAFLGGPADFFSNFAQVTDRHVSEVQSISAPVSNGQPVVDFYERVFGWHVVFEYAIDDPSFSALVGVREPLRLRSRNVGPSTREPYFGIIDYGLPAELGSSLLGRAKAPHRGLLGAVIVVDDLDRVRQAAGDGSGHVVAMNLEPFGLVRGSVIVAPHGVPHLVLEPTTTDRG